KIPEEVSEVRDYVRHITEDLEPIFGPWDRVVPPNELLVYPRAGKNSPKTRFAKLRQFRLGSAIALPALALSRFFAERAKQPNRGADFSGLLESRNTPRSEQPAI